MEDEYRPQPWSYESILTDPLGVRVHVTVTVPPSAFLPPAVMQDAAELAQMGASFVMNRLTKIRKDEQEKAPF